MKLIDADRFSDHVLADSHTETEIETWAWLDEALKTEPPIEAVPISFIHALLTDPVNAGDKNRALSWLLNVWREKVETGIDINDVITRREGK